MFSSGQIVLVTGASGFIGRALTADLARRGYQVRAASRAPSGSADAGVTPIRLPDLAAEFDPRPLVAGVAAVVHVAGLAHADDAAPDAAYQAINAQATRRLAIAARESGAQRFVLISSVRAQCGPSSAVMLTEALSPAPTDAYGRSKLAAEAAVAETFAGSNVAWTCLRPVLVYGPGVKGNMAALMRLAAMPVPLPFGGLTGRRSIVSLGNLASAVAHALAPDGRAGGVYLVADAEPVTAPQIVTALRAGVGRPGRLVAVPEAALMAGLKAIGRSGAAERLFGDLVVDTAKLRATGWRPVEDSVAALQAAMRARLGAGRCGRAKASH